MNVKCPGGGCTQNVGYRLNYGLLIVRTVATGNDTPIVGVGWTEDLLIVRMRKIGWC